MADTTTCVPPTARERLVNIDARLGGLASRLGALRDKLAAPTPTAQGQSGAPGNAVNGFVPVLTSIGSIENFLADIDTIMNVVDDLL